MATSAAPETFPVEGLTLFEIAEILREIDERFNAPQTLQGRSS